MMDIWTVPVVIVILIIAYIGWKSVRNWNEPVVRLNNKDQQIPEVVEENPFTVNPIIWVIAVASVFILFVIFYYWASSS
ncbi:MULTISPECIES: hypothetical protein [Sporosarcina]|uniref:Short-chain dehydrogenase n=1 Tax=Sporosarcina saromensis TaxID=359365 RepID=A0ABU4G4P6_9BACL|nr:hypothetical protein [Sporosarcina saromensis]MDW0111949.1 hypothetical protein [Sporosarcina saromensis]